MEEAIARIVAAAPPLTREQLNTLHAVFNGTEASRDTAP